MANMHDKVRPSFDSHVAVETGQIPLHVRLPPIFGPARITSYLLQYAKHRRMSSLLTESPRQLSQGSTLARAVTALEEQNYLVAALQSGDRRCDLCEESHLAPDCPRLRDLDKDERRRKRLAYQLSDQAVARRSGTVLRQVDLDVDANGDSADLTSDAPGVGERDVLDEMDIPSDETVIDLLDFR